jgi:hypothetical protein
VTNVIIIRRRGREGREEIEYEDGGGRRRWRGIGGNDDGRGIKLITIGEGKGGRRRKKRVGEE